jgi:hypothetical protein
MGQVLHGSATTTEAVRRAIQHSQESLMVLAKRYGINQKTVVKWEHRTSVADIPTGPKDARSTVLSISEEAIIVAFRKLHEKATTRVAADFLRALIQAVPYKIHTVLTDNGIHFTTPGKVRSTAADIRAAMALDEGKLGGPVDRDEEVKLTLLCANLSDVDVEVADCECFELAFD